MNFAVKWFQTIVASMVNYFTGINQQVTDFNIGSRMRTMLESVALEIEQVYYQVYLGIEDAIRNSVFNSFNFPALPAQAAIGLVRFSRSTTATQNYNIPAGTVVMTQPSETQVSISFVTIAAAVLLSGDTYVDVQVICTTVGSIGNVLTGTINQMTTSPAGIETVANPNDFYTGKDAETPDAQKTRFQSYISNLSRATLPSLTYAAKQVPNVIDAIAVESPACFCFAYSTLTTTYTDNSFEANLPSGIPFFGLSNPSNINDIMYVGSKSHFDGVRFDIEIGRIGGTLVWEYWNGTNWVTLPATDPTNYLAQNGLLNFTIPSDWHQIIVNGQLAFYIRLRAVVAISLPPSIYEVNLPPYRGTIEVIAYDATLSCSTALQGAILTALNEYRAAGIRVLVVPPVVTNLTFNVLLYLDPNVDAATIQTVTKQNINNYMNQFVLGQNLYLTELVQYILNSNEYIYDVTINLPADNYIVSSDEILRAPLANITVTYAQSNT